MSLARYCVPAFLSFVAAIFVLLQAMALAHAAEHLDAEHEDHRTECVKCKPRTQLGDDGHLPLPPFIQVISPTGDYYEAPVVYKEAVVATMAWRRLRLRGPPLA